VIARTLARRIVFRTPDRDVFEALRYLECTPDIVGHPPQEAVISVEPFKTYFRLVENGIVIKEVLGAWPVAEYLHGRLFVWSVEDRPEAAVLHAACLRRNGRRLLLVGPKSSGKTTLTLRLAHAGYEIEGDEHVFLGAAGVVARPRACRVKEPSLPYLPELADAISATAFFTDYMGSRIFNVDPRAIGATNWRIDEGKVDLIFILQPNHGGYSSIRPMPTSALVLLLMSEIGMRETGRGSSVAALASLAGRAKGFDLSLGDHETAIRCIDAAVAST
jgi:hypothetical protein